MTSSLLQQSIRMTTPARARETSRTRCQIEEALCVPHNAHGKRTWRYSKVVKSLGMCYTIKYERYEGWRSGTGATNY